MYHASFEPGTGTGTGINEWPKNIRERPFVPNTTKIDPTRIRANKPIHFILTTSHDRDKIDRKIFAFFKKMNQKRESQFSTNNEE